MLVVIDGPAGSGKSTVARLLAKQLNAFYLDTGAMYRAVTLRALRLGTDLTDSQALGRVAADARIELIPEGDGCRVLLDGVDVSLAIRTREVTNAIHYLANQAEVRDRIVPQQQALASQSETHVVAEGRDLASVVFPDADLKIYLDASVEERARRRVQDLGDAAPPLEELKAEIETRDRRDETRDVAPLVRVPEAVYVDTSAMTREQVLERLVELVERAAG